MSYNNNLSIEDNKITINNLCNNDVWSIIVIDGNFMLNKYNGRGNDIIEIIPFTNLGNDLYGNIKFSINNNQCYNDIINNISGSSNNILITPKYITLYGQNDTTNIYVSSNCDWGIQELPKDDTEDENELVDIFEYNVNSGFTITSMSNGIYFNKELIISGCNGFTDSIYITQKQSYRTNNVLSVNPRSVKLNENNKTFTIDVISVCNGNNIYSASTKSNNITLTQNGNKVIGTLTADKLDNDTTVTITNDCTSKDVTISYDENTSTECEITIKPTIENGFTFTSVTATTSYTVESSSSWFVDEYDTDRIICTKNGNNLKISLGSNKTEVSGETITIRNREGCSGEIIYNVASGLVETNAVVFGFKNGETISTSTEISFNLENNENEKTVEVLSYSGDDKIEWVVLKNDGFTIPTSGIGGTSGSPTELTIKTNDTIINSTKGKYTIILENSKTYKRINLTVNVNRSQIDVEDGYEISILSPVSETYGESIKDGFDIIVRPTYNHNGTTYYIGDWETMSSGDTSFKGVSAITTVNGTSLTPSSTNYDSITYHYTSVSAEGDYRICSTATTNSGDITSVSTCTTITYDLNAKESLTCTFSTNTSNITVNSDATSEIISFSSYDEDDNIIEVNQPTTPNWLSIERIDDTSFTLNISENTSGTERSTELSFSQKDNKCGKGEQTITVTQKTNYIDDTYEFSTNISDITLSYADNIGMISCYSNKNNNFFSGVTVEKVDCDWITVNEMIPTTANPITFSFNVNGSSDKNRKCEIILKQDESDKKLKYVITQDANTASWFSFNDEVYESDIDWIIDSENEETSAITIYSCINYDESNKSGNIQPYTIVGEIGCAIDGNNKVLTSHTYAYEHTFTFPEDCDNGSIVFVQDDTFNQLTLSYHRKCACSKQTIVNVTKATLKTSGHTYDGSTCIPVSGYVELNTSIECGEAEVTIYYNITDNGDASSILIPIKNKSRTGATDGWVYYSVTDDKYPNTACIKEIGNGHQISFTNTDCYESGTFSNISIESGSQCEGCSCQVNKITVEPDYYKFTSETEEKSFLVTIETNNCDSCTKGFKVYDKDNKQVDNGNSGDVFKLTYNGAIEGEYSIIPDDNTNFEPAKLLIKKFVPYCVFEIAKNGGVYGESISETYEADDDKSHYLNINVNSKYYTSSDVSKDIGYTMTSDSNWVSVNGTSFEVFDNTTYEARNATLTLTQTGGTCSKKCYIYINQKGKGESWYLSVSESGLNMVHSATETYVYITSRKNDEPYPDLIFDEECEWITGEPYKMDVTTDGIYKYKFTTTKNTSTSERECKITVKQEGNTNSSGGTFTIKQESAPSCDCSIISLSLSSNEITINSTTQSQDITVTVNNTNSDCKKGWLAYGIDNNNTETYLTSGSTGTKFTYMTTYEYPKVRFKSNDCEDVYTDLTVKFPKVESITITNYMGATTIFANLGSDSASLDNGNSHTWNVPTSHATLYVTNSYDTLGGGSQYISISVIGENIDFYDIFGDGSITLENVQNYGGSCSMNAVCNNESGMKGLICFHNKRTTLEISLQTQN